MTTHTITGPQKFTTEEPTLAFRWHSEFFGGPEKLQQLWNIRHMENGVRVGGSVEWRDVPKIIGG